MSTIIGTLIVLGGTGLLFGFLLSFASLKLKPKEDPLLEKLKDALPGANCGGCGVSGCGQFAEELFANNIEITACPVGGDDLVKKLAALMGTEPSKLVKQIAFVKCVAGKSKTKSNYTYIGMRDCFAMAKLAGGGAKTCVHGCMGGGSCVQSCVFQAIKIVDGIAEVSREKCVSCTKCVSSCPKNIIEMIPSDVRVQVGCNSTSSAKTVRECCDIGCIGCKICEKKCPHESIIMGKNLAGINYETCTSCMICADVCPRKCILMQ